MGSPGAGKSTLMKHAYQEASTNRLLLENCVVLGFFFYGQGEKLQRTPLGLFRSLIHQILSNGKLPQVLFSFSRTEFKSRVEKYGKVDKDWQWHEGDLRVLFTEIVTSLSQSRQVRIFVDALDEAGKETAQDLVDFFQDLTRGSDSLQPALSIYFSCRPVPIIRWKSGTICDVEKHNREAIKTYVHTQLDRVAAHDMEDARVLEKEIINRDSGIF